MQSIHSAIKSHDYAKFIEVSKRVRWDIDNDIIRERKLNLLMVSERGLKCRL